MSSFISKNIFLALKAKVNFGPQYNDKISAIPTDVLREYLRSATHSRSVAETTTTRLVSIKCICNNGECDAVEIARYYNAFKKCIKSIGSQYAPSQSKIQSEFIYNLEPENLRLLVDEAVSREMELDDVFNIAIGIATNIESNKASYLYYNNKFK